MTGSMAINHALYNTPLGGSWSNGSGEFQSFDNYGQALSTGARYISQHGAWASASSKGFPEIYNRYCQCRVNAIEMLEYDPTNQNVEMRAWAQQAVDVYFATYQGPGLCSTCLDESTLHKNLFGLSYPGGNNPRSNNNDYNYSYVPYSKAEYPAIGHDRRYDNLKIVGLTGLLLDTRSIGADWRFVIEEFNIAFNPRNRNEQEKLQAFILGVGLGIAALPKTIVTFGSGNPGAYANVSMWYHISNIGVTNDPKK